MCSQKVICGSKCTMYLTLCNLCTCMSEDAVLFLQSSTHTGYPFIPDLAAKDLHSIYSA